MIKTTIISVSVHNEHQNAIFGEGVTHVILEDEAAGGFIQLKQCDDNSEVGSLRLDIDELDAIHDAAHMLLKQYKA